MKKQHPNHSVKTKFARKPLISVLEPRLLLDGAAVATAVDILTDTQLHDAFHTNSTSQDTDPFIVVAPTEVRPVDPSQNNGKKEVAFIVDNVTDPQTLIDGINAGVEIVLLDSNQDGLAQMALWAQSNSDYDAIHIISHGAEGQVNLGGFSLDNITVNTRSADLAQLGAALNEDGDLLLYGCKVASGEGQDFITALAQATQADVAASDDLTGAAVLGGDWDLEASIGSVTTEAVINAVGATSFSGILADATLTFEAGTGSFSGVDTSAMTFTESATTSGVEFTFTANLVGGAADIVKLGSDYGQAYNGAESVYFGVNDPVESATMTIQSGGVFDLISFNLSNQGPGPNGGDDTFAITTSKGGAFTTAIIAVDSNALTLITLPTTAAFQGITWFSISPHTGNAAFLEIDDIVLTNISFASNNAPTITGAPSDITVTEDTASNVDLSGVTFADSDGDNLTVTLTASAGTLAASSGGNVTVSGSGTGALTLSGTAADINSYLDTTSNVQYTGASNASGDNAATLTIKANDSTVDSSTSTVNIDITAVNDAPTAISPTTATVSTFDSDNATVATVSATDVDDSALKYSIYSITLDNVPQANDGSLFNFATDADTLVATNALRATTPSGLTAGTYIVSVVATDAGGLAATQEITITVTDTLVVTTANDTSEDAADAYNGNSYAAELADGGGLSLREALGLAQAGGKTIAFDTSLNGKNISLDSIISVADGTVFQLANGTSFTISGSSLVLNGGLTINNAASNNLTLSANLTDNGSVESSLTKTGAGTLILSGTNNTDSTGLNTIEASGGILQISANSNLGTNEITLNGGVNFLTTTNVLNVDNTFAIQDGGATFNQMGSGHLTLSGVVEGDSLLTKAGAGTLTLSADNVDFAGGVRINNGTLNAKASVESLGYGAVTLAGGTLAFSDAGTFGNGITVSADATISNSTDVTLSGEISGSGDLIKLGAGVLTLSGDNNSYSGDISLYQGVIVAAHNNALGNTTGSTTVASGTTLRIGNGLTLAENLNLSGAGTNPTFGALQINEGTGAATVTGNITLENNSIIGVSNAGDSLTLSGVISGDFNLTKGGSGTLTLSGANTHSGAVTVSQGALALSGGSSIGDSSAVTVSSGATLSLTGGAETIGSLSGAGAVSLSYALTLGNASNTVFSGVISSTNTSGITKVGSGTLTLNGANTYTGVTTVSAGKLLLQDGSAIADSSAVTISSGAEIELRNSNETIGSLAGAGTLTLNGGSLTVGGNNSDTIFSGQIQDGGNSGGLIKTGSGTLTFTAGDGINTYSGGTTVDSGTLAISRSSHLGTGTIILDGGTLQMLSGGNFSFANAMTNALVLASDSTIDTASGVYAKWSNVISGSGSLTKTGTGSLGVTAVNTYTGDTTLSEGAIVIDSATATLGGADAGNGNAYGTLTIQSGAHLDFNYGATIANDLVIGGVGVGYGAIQAGFSGTNVTFSGAVTLSSDTLVDPGNITLEFSGGISDGGNGYTLTNAWNGTVKLSGAANNWTGGIATVANHTGKFSITDASNIGSGQITLNGGSLIIADATTLSNAVTLGSGGGSVDASDLVTLSGVLSGTDAFTKLGAGTLTLSGTNTHSGAVTVSAGTLALSGGSSIGDDSAVTVNSGATLSLTGGDETIGSLSGSGAVVLSSGLIVGNASSTTFSGNISSTNTSGITKVGSGELNLSGANTYTGSTTVSAGRLVLDNGLAIADSSAVIISAGAELELRDSNEAVGSLSGAGTLTLNGGTLTVGADNSSTTFSGVIQNGDGTGGLSKAGSGTLTLTGNNTYSGATTVSAGTLIAASDTALGTTAGATTVSSGAALELGNGVDVAEAVSIAGVGGLKVNTGSATLSGNLTLTADARVTVATNATLTSSGAWAGAYTAYKFGAGSLVLSGANNGATTTNLTVSAGNLLISDASNLVGGTLTLNTGVSGSLTVTGSDVTIGKNVVLGANGGRIVNENAVTMSGVISGAGALAKAGAGTLTLSAANTLTGALSVTGGTLAVGASAITTTSSLTLDGGTLASTAILSYAKGISLGANGGTLNISGGSMSLSGIISGSGSLTSTSTNAGNALTLSGINTYTGGTTLSSGILQFNNDSAVGDGALTINGGKVRAGLASRTLSNDLILGGTLTMAGSYGLTFSGDVDLGGATRTVDNGLGVGTDLTLAGVVSNGSLTVASNGAGKVILSGTNIISAASVTKGILSVTSDANLGNGTVTLNGGTLEVTGTTTTTIDNAIVVGSSGGTVNNADAVTLSGVVSGTGALTKAGAGTMTLSATNTHTGNVIVSAGNMAVSGGSSIGDDSAVTVNSGATLSLTGGNETIGSLSGSGAVALTYGLTVGNASSTTFSGVISSTNTSGITKVGTGTLMLSGVNTYTGSTTVSAGKLVATGGSAIADASAVTISTGAELELRDQDEAVGSIAGAGTLTLNGGTLTVGGNNNSTIFSGAIQDSGGLTKIGTGTLTLSGSNSYEGTTTVLSGGLSISGDSNLGSGALTLNSGTLSVTGDGANIDNTIAVSFNGGVVNVDTGVTATLSGLVSGTGDLTKSGNGKLTLSAANTLTGALSVTEGTLAFSANNNISSTSGLTLDGGTLASSATVTYSKAITLGSNGGTLNISGGSMTLSGVISGDGSLTSTSTSAGNALTLSGNNTYTGGTILTGGIMQFNNDSAAGTGIVTIDSASSKLRAGLAARTLSNDLVLNSTLTLAGSNALTFSGSVDLGGVDRTIDNSINSDLTFSGVISNGSITIGGSGGTGAVVLSGNNTHTNTTISGGNTTTNTNSLSIASDANLGTGTLTLNGAGAVLNITGATTIDNAIAMGSSGGTVNNADAVTLSGVVSGTGALTKAGAGTMTLSAANTHTGNATVAAGTMAVSGGSAIGDDSAVTVNSGATLSLIGGDETIGSLSGSGAVVLSSGLIVGNASSTNFSGNISSTNTSGITKVGSGELNLSGANTYTGSTTVSAGRLVLDNGLAIADSSAVIISAGAELELRDSNEAVGSLSGAGTLTLNGGTLTVGADNSSTTFSGVIQNGDGTGGLSKAGSGTLTLTGNNTYSGATTVSAGTLIAASDTALGTTAGATTVSSGAALELGNGVDVAEAVSIAGVGGLKVNTGSATLSGNLTLTADARVTVATNATLTSSGAWAGAYTAYKFGAGSLVLSGANNGATTTNLTVSAGNLLISDASNLVGGTLTLNTGVSGSLTVTGSDVTIGKNVVLGASGGRIVNENAVTMSGVISGAGALTKAGAGVLTLDATNTYIGSTTINGGALTVLGTMNGSGAGMVTLNTGTLEGSGTINSAVTVNSGATLSAGIAANTGTLTINGDLILGGTLSAQLNSANDYDKVVVIGSVTLGADSAFDITNSASAGGNTFVLIDNDGNDAVTGTLNGVGEGDTLISNSLGYRTSYVGGTGNDVTLQDNSAPVITSSDTASVDENAATSTVVYTATATDDDNDIVSFSLTGDDAAAFDIDSSTGVVTLKVSADYETKASYSFTVVATDNSTGNLTDTKAVIVSVNDLNDNAPVMTSGATASIDENADISTVVYTATATDADGTSANNTISFSLTGTDAAAFDIDSTTGVVTLKASADYETKASYSFTVVATDNGTGNLTDTQAVVVSVNDVNEAPVITSGSTGSVAENAAISTVIYTATATDVDSGDTLTYSLTGADAALLDINAITGVVTLKASADYETKASYSFTVVATDNGTGNLTDTQAVVVTVSDVNEAPVMTSGTTGTVDENAAINTVIYTATAADVDSGDTLTYSLTGADAALLNINSVTGEVTLKASADYETKASYSFNVVATDNGASNFNSGNLSVSQAVTVTVNDLNDNAPVITSGTLASIDENADLSTVVYTATATDADGTSANNTISFSLTGADAAAFDIDSTTGEVTLKASADYETKASYSFTVVATDNGTGNLTDTQAVTVSVNDLNDNAPVITSGTTASVDENTDLSTVVYTATATDADGTIANNTISFSLTGADAAAFDIDSTTGDVTLKASADYETKASYSFTVVATDNGTGNLTDTQAVVVTVNDVNEAPVMTSGTTGTVDENAAINTVIYTATAADVDSGDTLTYSLTGADAALLNINSVTGEVTLKASADYETKASYSFNVVATDNGASNFNSGNLSVSQAVTVTVNDLNDNAPVITSGTLASIDENTDLSTVVYTATATDADGTSANNTISFSLTGADAAAFDIDSTTGEVTLKASADYETKASYSFTVVATDNGTGNLTDTQAVVVTVNDVNEAPVMTSGTTGTVDENAAINTVIYTATATDVDAGDTLTYSLTGADAALLNINSVTGEVTLKASADYETKASYSFTVVATDNGASNVNAGNLSVSQAVVVIVNDVNEAPVITSGSTGSVAENAAISTVIYTATATDVDAGDTLTYSLTGADAALLNINSVTGEVTLKASADYETKASYSFNVVATDNGASNFNSGNLSVSQAVTVSVNDLNDNAPVITSGAIASVDENADLSTVVYTATATDADGTSANNTISFSLTGTDAAAFDINSTTGVVTLKASADYETKASYSFTVVATDNGTGNLTDTQAVTVSVNDLNDNAPVITSGATASVDENADLSTVVYTATATDADGSSANNTISFSLTGTDAAAFDINSTTGEVTLKASADYETKASYSFTVVATDNGTGNLTASQAVVVSVNDVNEAPVITSGSTGSVAENAAISTVIYTATATDVDTADTLTYSLTGADAALLNINSVTGEVTLKASADYETKASYSFTVVVTDNGTGNLTASQAVVVSVNDINEAPVITSGSTGNVAENAATSTVIYTATATDVDTADTLTYSLTGTDAALLEINSSTGEVTLKASADYETKASYSFTVVATDNGTGNLTASQAVVVSVNDINEAPVITSGNTGSVAENAAISTVIYTATATDVDAADTLTYSLTGADAALLEINSSTGEVTLKASADYETKASYSFTVVATDNGTGNLTASQAVVVSVNDINEAPVIISGSTGSVAENAATSTVIYTATATDVDAADTLTYSLTGADAALLEINSSTGEVTLKASADYETKTSYSFTVVATDNGTGNLTASQAVVVSVNDVNEAPVITSGSTGSVAENAPTSTVIYTATATDIDSADTLTYSLTGTDAALLEINSSTGEVTLKASADYETKASYSFTVVATDNGTGNLTASQAVTVSVNDVNEAPVITSGSTGNVAENAAISTVIYTATATDVDSADTLTYSLTGTDAALLEINSSTGEVTLKASADYETKASYSFTVVVTDNGTGNLTTSQAVVVSVNDVNEAPVITSGSTGSVAENAAISTVIYTATATDVDAADTLTYSLTGTDAALLEINSSTGEVTLKASADYETKASYSFTVVVTDNGTGNLTDTQAVTVSVNDLNDNTPMLNAGAVSAILVEAGGVANGDMGTNSAQIILVKGDVDTVNTVVYDIAYLLNNGWTTADNGITYNNVGTYGTATLILSTDAVNYSLNNSSSATEALLAGQAANDSFSIQVTDGSFTQATNAVFSIVGANDAPTVTSTVANLFGTSGQAFTPVTLPAALFTDVDAGESAQLVWSIENLPTGLVFNPVTRTISGTPQGGFEGVNTLQVVATDANGAQVKLPVTLTLNPAPVIAMPEAPIVNAATSVPIPTENAGVNTPILPVTFETLPTGVIQTSEGAKGFVDDVMLETGNQLFSAALASNLIVFESKVEVSVGADGQLQVTETGSVSGNTTSLSIANISSESGQVLVVIEDTTAGASYSGTLADGSDLPAWVTVNPATGEITITPPEGQGKVTLRINATDADGNTRILEIEVDLTNLPRVAPSLTTELSTGHDVIFLTLDQQLTAAAEQYDDYGNELMKLLVS